jgi:hypothetical protein
MKQAARSPSSAASARVPFNRAEMERLFLNRRGFPYKVQDSGSMADWLR